MGGPTINGFYSVIGAYPDVGRGGVRKHDVNMKALAVDSYPKRQPASIVERGGGITATGFKNKVPIGVIQNNIESANNLATKERPPPCPPNCVVDGQLTEVKPFNSSS